MALVIKKLPYVPGYRINLNSVSSVVDNGHKKGPWKEKVFFATKAEKNPNIKERKTFHTRPQGKKFTLLTQVGGQIKQNSGTNVRPT